jgi:hypothetical protein
VFLFGLSGLMMHHTWARPAEIIIIRHAEKPVDDFDMHLSPQGEQRAQALVDFLTTTPLLVTNGLPVALFASRATPRGHGQRTWETVEPLSKRLKLPIRTPYPAADYEKLAKLILEDPKFDGKTVLICWVHEFLPELAEALGVKKHPWRWKSNTYDRVWVITFHGRKTILSDLPQHLLPGDTER